MGARVLCEWRDPVTKKVKTYPAIVFSKYRGQYGIYYILDGYVRRRVSSNELHFAPADAGWAKTKDTDFLNQTFHNNTDAAPLGEYEVLSVGKGRDVNKFFCQLLNGKSGRKKTCHFDKGYVMKKLLPDMFPFDSKL